MVWSGLEPSLAEAVAGPWELKSTDLSHRVASSALTVNRLVDMSWSFGVTLATDEVDAIGETFLQLKLVLDGGSGARRNVYMELTLPQFYRLYAELQRAQTIVDYLASGAA